MRPPDLVANAELVRGNHDRRDIQPGRSSRTMTTTLNPSFDHRALQRASTTGVTTLNPSFDRRRNQYGSGTGTVPTTLNPVITTSLPQRPEHANPPADRAA
jgi:hypothetical protein